MVKITEYIEFLTDNGQWELAICGVSEHNSFAVLCLDGESRTFEYIDKDIMWRETKQPLLCKG